MMNHRENFIFFMFGWVIDQLLTQHPTYTNKQLKEYAIFNVNEQLQLAKLPTLEANEFDYYDQTVFWIKTMLGNQKNFSPNDFL